MYRCSLFLTAALLGTNVALVQNVASAQSVAEVGEMATDITLEILSNNSSKTGSGILLQQHGDVYTILTVAHAVTSGNSFTIKTPDGQAHLSLANSVRRAGKNIDLAVMKFRSNKQYAVAKIGNSNSIKIGEPAYVAGFPRSTYVAAAGTLNFTEGKIIGKASKANQDGYSLFYSNTTLAGMSGGPVLDQKGELIAIHGQGDRLGKDGEGAKTGRNLGITVERFGTVAQAMGVKLEQPTANVPQNQQPNAADYLLTAFEKYDRGDYQGALADYQRSLALDSNLAKAFEGGGFLRNALNNIFGIFEILLK
jgi:S1-C subfamily serine protease